MTFKPAIWHPIALALSALTYWTVERPALRRKTRNRLPEPAPDTQRVTVGV